MESWKWMNEWMNEWMNYLVDMCWSCPCTTVHTIEDVGVFEM
jgi:hypothetical protein